MQIWDDPLWNQFWQRLWSRQAPAPPPMRLQAYERLKATSKRVRRDSIAFYPEPHVYDRILDAMEGWADDILLIESLTYQQIVGVIDALIWALGQDVEVRELFMLLVEIARRRG